jgi:glutamate-1-semialdehyde 2,1-aminomutase
MTATIGRREIMEAAQSSFISSTFWTERIGPAASLKTLEVMERIESWRVITEMGIYIRAGFQRLADSYGLKIKHWGMPALTGYTFDSPQALAYKTFITQAMLAKGYLVGNSVYVCTEHTREVVDHFLDELDPVFAKVRDFENGESVVNALHGPICHTSFSRLN